jgi:hypothetical protein
MKRLPGALAFPMVLAALPIAAAAAPVIMIRTLVSGDRPAGRQSVHWDGRDDGGRAAESGVYFARLNANGRDIDIRFAMTR